MQISPAPQVVVPHAVPPPPAPARPPLPPALAPPDPPAPAAPPLCMPPLPRPPDPERPPALGAPEPPPVTAPPVPEVPPVPVPPVPVFPPGAPPVPGDPPVAEPAAPFAPELPPAVEASATLLVGAPLFSFDEHAEIKTTATAAIDRVGRVVLIVCPSAVGHRAWRGVAHRVRSIEAAGRCTRRLAQSIYRRRTRRSHSRSPCCSSGRCSRGSLCNCSSPDCTPCCVDMLRRLSHVVSLEEIARLTVEEGCVGRDARHGACERAARRRAPSGGGRMIPCLDALLRGEHSSVGRVSRGLSLS